MSGAIIEAEADGELAAADVCGSVASAGAGS